MRPVYTNSVRYQPNEQAARQLLGGEKQGYSPLLGETDGPYSIPADGAKRLTPRQALGKQCFEGNHCWSSPLNVAKRER